MKMLILALLMAAITILLAVVPQKLKTPYKLLLSVVVLLGCLKQQLIRLAGGPLFFAPDLPSWILLPSNWLYAVTVLFFLLLAASWILLAVTGGIAWCWRKIAWGNFMRHFRKLPLILLILSIVLTSWGMYCGMTAPEVKRVTFAHKQLPAAAENMRIAVLADLHIDNITCGERIQELVEQTNALQSDVIVILGDIVDGTVQKRRQDVLLLKKLQAPYGVFAIMGNHDCYSGYREWMEFFRQMNFTMLENRHYQLPNKVYLSGLPDPAARKMAGVEPDLEQTLSGIPAEAFNILLAHRPGTAHEAAGRSVDLQLSGHTHGGMIRFFDRLIGRFNGGFISGFYRLNDLTLYVSNGTAIWNGFPIRLGRPSEITLITLKRL